jgi:Holliday junction resolvase RusA-like endonuclease
MTTTDTRPVAAVAMRVLTIDVLGTPAPQGSKSFKGMRGGHAILVESSKKVGPWRAAVEAATRARMALTGWVMLDEPVEVSMIFWLARPQTAPKGRIAPDRYPDLSKLARSSEDALVTAGAIADDARICRAVLTKVYAVPPAPVGARIVVSGVVRGSGVALSSGGVS